MEDILSTFPIKRSLVFRFWPVGVNCLIVKYWFKWKTEDFTGILSPRAFEKASVFNALGLGNAGEVQSRVFEPLLLNFENFQSTSTSTSKYIFSK